MDTFFWVLITFLFSLAIFGFVMNTRDQRTAETTRNTLLAHGGGRQATTYVSYDGKSGISLSGDGASILVHQPYGQPLLLGREDVIGAEVIKDGTLITKTNRGSQVSGAIVGAALLGPVGLLLGGVTGTKRSEEKLNPSKLGF
jgi:hypothetical protein